MNGTEFQQKREALGLTISDLGHIIDVRQDTIRKWEDGRAAHGPHPTACRVLDWMIAGYRPREWPQPIQFEGTDRVRCMDCRCHDDGSCPGETLQQQAAWRQQMAGGM